MTIPSAKLPIIFLFLQFAALAPSSARSDEMPVFDSSYCINLTAKMLDEDEKTVETKKCLDTEADARARLNNYWKIVSETAFGYCRTLSPGSYGALERCLARKTGSQCFSGELHCDWN